MNDETLGGGLPDVEADETLGSDDITDVTPDLDVEDFDFDEFVAGVRPGRKQVKVYMRADLAAELDVLLARAEDLPADMDPDERKAAEDALLDEFESVKEQIRASARTFIVEARSESRARHLVKQMEKTGWQKPGKKASEDRIREWNEELAFRRLADAIIVPSNVTADGLRKLDAVAEAESNKLFGAFAQVNQNPTQAVTPNFSLRR